MASAAKARLRLSRAALANLRVVRREITFNKNFGAPVPFAVLARSRVRASPIASPRTTECGKEKNEHERPKTCLIFIAWKLTGVAAS